MSNDPSEDPIDAKVYEIREAELRTIGAKEPNSSAFPELTPATAQGATPTMEDVAKGFSTAFGVIGLLSGLTAGTAKAGMDLLRSRMDRKP